MSTQIELALAACRSIRFATDNALRHGGEYSLNDLLSADKLAREAINSQMTPEFIDRGARGLLNKYRAQHTPKKGGAA